MSYVRDLTEDEYEEIMDNLYWPNCEYLYRRTKVWCILALEAQAGLKLKTARVLRKCDIRYDEEAREYYVEEYLPKSQKHKKLKIPNNLVEKVLYIGCNKQPEEPLFEGYRGSDGQERPMTARAVEKVLKEVAEDLFIDGVSTRSFYKYFYNGPAEEDDED